MYINEPTILFVYNAEHGIFNLLSDIAKKSFNIEGTCSLCDLTHDPLKMKSEWKRFIDSLPYPSEFAYKDTLQKEYPERKDTLLPAVFLRDDAGLTPLLSAHEINDTPDPWTLKESLRTALDEQKKTTTEDHR